MLIESENHFSFNSSKVEAVSTRLADFLERRKERIPSEWLKVVHRDREIPSTEKTPDPHLIDHIPKLLDTLVNLLRSPAGELMPREAVNDAREHGVHRCEQGYELSEMLRELAVFRTILIEHIGAFSEADPQFVGRIQSTAVARIHGFLDESGRWSTVQFVQKQQALIDRAKSSRLNVLRGVSHELGNALNGIRLAARALRRATDGQIEEIEQAIKRGVQFMSEMLDDLREIASMEAGEENLNTHSFAPLTVVQDIASTYGLLAEEKGLRFTWKTDPSLPEVVSDERRIKQVAVNLVSNAIKYTASGEVRLEVRSVDAEKWAITVVDTGVGIAPEYQQKIFEEFFRVSATSAAEGMGLGLAVATRQVHLLGGETRIESAPGKGSRFEVILPKVLNAPAPISNS